ncbi:DNA polymerase I [Pseudokineococcus lusitanus]|uniref:DNA polymerase I n=1 Tax=Pseudokineococcus lusitanus TaxID=763993 RepID=A0A3N1HSA8_9ACTN|nr:DNA polymerase I [Pseudokineococcus lusitanus]ROP45425.1 DNA polymerase I [Pseudokineococcus lusitanus]
MTDSDLLRPDAAADTSLTGPAADALVDPPADPLADPRLDAVGDGPRPRLLLVDGHSMAYRAFFALPADNFSTSTGQVTNAVYGFTSMLINVLRDEAPTHVAVAFDVSRQTFRAAEYAEYKAGRAKTPTEFAGQVPLVKEVLAALRITVVEKEGYEADDVIATLATQARARGFETLVSTGDRDALQLVDEATTVLYPRKGVSDLVRMTPDAVEEKYGVRPARYPDLAALVGETSDNLPGVPGVGPKTAAKWLATHDGLEGVVAAVDTISGKAGASLREHLDQVLRNRRLNRLVADLDLPVGVDDLALVAWDREEVHRVFDSLEFRVLRDRLFATLQAAEPEAEGGFAVEVARPRGADVAAWLDARAAGRAALHVTGRWGGGTGEVTGLAVAGEGGAAWFPLGGDDEPDPLDDEGRAAVAAWLADADRPKVLHDAKGPLLALAGSGLPVAGLVDDTALAAYLCRPDQRSFDLADLVLRHLHRELRLEEPAGEAAAPADADDQLALDVDGTGAATTPDPAPAAAVRAAAVLELSGVLAGELAERGGSALLAELELPLVGVLARMERRGVAADRAHLEALEEQFAATVSEQAEAAYAVIDRRVNLGSPKQLQEVLFEQLGMPKTKRNKTGYTTDAEALADLLVKTEDTEGSEFLVRLLAHRDASRLRQTVEGLLKTVAPDGRIHTTYQQTIAATGRLSSTDPNLQNIPIRTEEGRRIRQAFVVGEGYESLLTADYSQIEMRIMAHLSGDEGLVEAFRSGEDLHSFVGSRVFEVEPAEVTPAMRSKIKAMSYGLAYGLSAFGLSRQLRIAVDEARGLMDDYFERFGGVRDYLRGVVDAARTTGYTETILGRRRYLPDLTSDNRQRREMAERMALNAPIQGSAADVIKVAMLGVERALAEEGLRSRMLLQVHDELVLEVAPGEREVLEALVRREMGGAAELSVPLDVSVGVGTSWHEAGH